MNSETQEIFITKIMVNKVRHITDFEIPLSQIERKHLIITGKNGSGKTSLLLELSKFLDALDNLGYNTYLLHKKEVENINLKIRENSTDLSVESNRSMLRDFQSILDHFGGLEVLFSNSQRIANTVKKRESSEIFLRFFLDAKRTSEFILPKGIDRIDFDSTKNTNFGKNFVQYIVNLKAERSFARDDQDEVSVQKIDQWFNNFEKRLQYIFNDSSLRLVFDRKKFNFTIEINGLEPFSFSELSEGYSAILSIVTELIMRMEALDCNAYDLEGIVLIDEIENHLHVDLQKKILPFLCDFFPKIQFIVSTHSPFVLSSVSNAVICDLENKIVTTDLSGYSYDALIESYFGVDKYSSEVKEKLVKYKQLALHRPTDEDKEEYFALKQYFDTLPKYLEPELQAELQQIQLSILNRHN